MEPTRAAFGIWSGGRFMNFGVPIEESRMRDLMHKAHAQGVKTFMTADVYGQGAADEMVGSALSTLKRDTYSLVGAIGHDFYETRRDGAKGFPRFTNPELRQPSGYRDYLFMAAEKSLARCRTDHFDLLLLHNPDQIGYSSDVVWDAMRSLKEQGLTKKIGVGTWTGQ
ncbi:MAG: aldo/keto reductase, partial [Verrucomicrobia bacterium]|nr:aldo/keto reductase [Verrucomicrobiota bacterium]